MSWECCIWFQNWNSQMNGTVLGDAASGISSGLAFDKDQSVEWTVWFAKYTECLISNTKYSSETKSNV